MIDFDLTILRYIKAMTVNRSLHVIFPYAILHHN